MKALLKTPARFLLGDYAIYRVYERAAEAVAPRADAPEIAAEFRSIDREETSTSADRAIRDQSFYHGAYSHAFGCVVDDRIVATCFYWHGQRYRSRNFWPLGEREAKLVQVYTVSDVRGRGIATWLIDRSAARMLASGFERLYARIWHSNQPSIAAFAAAGWKQVAVVIEVNPLRRNTPWRIVRRVSRGIGST